MYFLRRHTHVWKVILHIWNTHDAILLYIQEHFFWVSDFLFSISTFPRTKFWKKSIKLKLIGQKKTINITTPGKCYKSETIFKHGLSIQEFLFKQLVCTQWWSSALLMKTVSTSTYKQKEKSTNWYLDGKLGPPGMWFTGRYTALWESPLLENQHSKLLLGF